MHAHRGHLAVCHRALPKTAVAKGRRAATCVLGHLAVEGGAVCSVEEVCDAGGGRWREGFLQEKRGALACASRSCPGRGWRACTTRGQSSLGVNLPERRKSRDRVAHTSWHTLSRRKAARDNPAMHPVRDSPPTELLSQREGMTLQRAAPSRAHRYRRCSTWGQAKSMRCCKELCLLQSCGSLIISSSCHACSSGFARA
jgi:hypothetical protein